MIPRSFCSRPAVRRRDRVTCPVLLGAALLACTPGPGWTADAPVTNTVTAEVIDDITGHLAPARVYIRSKDGKWFFPRAVGRQASVLRYERRNGANTNAVEMHATVSAHPFAVDLEPGTYTFTIERGKEYRPVERRVEVEAEPLHLKFPLRRWIHMASEGWYSGDGHVHRAPADLPNVMEAEDVNVVWPMTYWTTDDATPPSRSRKNMEGSFPARAVPVDASHVYYPRNTEYEIFETGGGRHTSGALLVLNHRSVFDVPIWPVSRGAARARAEGALLDLEKHNWEWTVAIAPIVRPDLLELVNNHHWRTEFALTNWAVPAPEWMGIGRGMEDERAWALYGFQTYYALLNCGLRIRPSAGTANGVHPVPLGYGRVYVKLDGAFSYEQWVRGLTAGRSFATTGPMLFARVDGEYGGRVVHLQPGERRSVTVEGSAVGEMPVTLIEVIFNGEVVRRIRAPLERTRERAWESPFREEIRVERPGWIAVRCWEEHEGVRVRFAHSAPTWIEMGDLPVRPRRREAEWLVERTRGEIARSGSRLPAQALAEYEQALRFYEEKLRISE